jgi:hypothetical protein
VAIAPVDPYALKLAPFHGRAFVLHGVHRVHRVHRVLVFALFPQDVSDERPSHTLGFLVFRVFSVFRVPNLAPITLAQNTGTHGITNTQASS